MTVPAIDIDRVSLGFLAVAAPDRAERAARRVRDAVVRKLPEALATACAPQLADEAWIFIDQLELACTVATHWDDDAVAGHIARQLAHALRLQRSLGQVLVFQDRTELVSAYVIALIEGRPSSRWWLPAFDGLAVLPVSQAIRTLIVAEGRPGLQALARLSPDAFRKVVSALDQSDVGRILAAIEQFDGPVATTNAVLGAVDAVELMALASPAHRLFAGLMEIVRRGAGEPSGATLNALEAVFDLASAMRREVAPRPAANNRAAMTAWIESANLSDRARNVLSMLDPDMIVPCFGGAADDDADALAPAAEPFSFTRYGGALLLGVILVKNGWWAAWRRALLESEAEARADLLAGWLGLAIVARALDPSRPVAIERDPALMRVFGVAAERRPVPSNPATKRVLTASLSAAGFVANVHSSARHLGPVLRAWARALLIDFGGRVPGCDGSSAAYLRRECLSLHASVDATGTAARLGRAPLDVLLVFSGLKRTSVIRPDGLRLTLSEEPFA